MNKFNKNENYTIITTDTNLKKILVNYKEESVIFLSKVAISFENLVIILPRGFSSKNNAVLSKKINI